MKIPRRFTKSGKGPYEGIEWDSRTSEIRNPDGTVVFRLEGVKVPTSWSSVASDVIAQKYFRRRGVPQMDENGKPVVDTRGSAGGSPVLGGETDARQVFHRMAGCWAEWGRRHGYFTTEDDAQAFYDELCRMLADQRCAPNSPQWFNTGLHWAYGIDGPPQGHYYVDPDTGRVKKSKSAYERPQPHACFIQQVDDDLVGPNGIMDLWVREGRLFKYGSGCTSGASRIYVRGAGFVPIGDLYARYEAEGRTVHDFDGKGRWIDVRDLGLEKPGQLLLLFVAGLGEANGGHLDRHDFHVQIGILLLECYDHILIERPLPVRGGKADCCPLHRSARFRGHFRRDRAFDLSLSRGLRGGLSRKDRRRRLLRSRATGGHQHHYNQ